MTERLFRLALSFTAGIGLFAQTDIRTQPAHLRSGPDREWSEFPAQALPALHQTFRAAANPTEYTLILRQRDVKLTPWKVLINGRELGKLSDDERDMRTALAVPAGVLRNGSNTLEIAPGPGPTSDDIEVRELQLYPQPVAGFLRQSSVTVETEAEGGPMPVRITVVDSQGVLVPLAALRKSDKEAVRTGVIYTIDGRTEIGLPAGAYQVYASRGFDYNAPSQRVKLKIGQKEQVRLQLRREVDLPASVSMDTHVHTLELSGHGDASVRERVITAAGEGLDMIVATEHNKMADYAEQLRALGLERWLTVVRGNEVTTAIGHFNIFPLRPASPVPDSRTQDWSALERSIRETGASVIVQNHPRDLHSNYRPFDASHHLSSAGENLNGRPFFANAVEVINSGATYSDVMQPIRDWLGLLNHGIRVAAIGGSDTHTVDFVPIGQARTYIEVGQLNGEWKSRPDAVFKSLAAGDNLVSYGLATRLRVMQVNPAEENRRSLVLLAEVYGPSWSAADHLTVYADGLPAAELKIPPNNKAGLKWHDQFRLNIPARDTTLVAVASGPGVLKPFWEVRKPYQPVSKDWNPRVVGVSKAVRVDVDGNGFQSPRDYAEALLQKHGSASPALLKDLHSYDASVAIQILSALAAKGQAPEGLKDSFAAQGSALKAAYDAFLAEWTKRGRQ